MTYLEHAGYAADLAFRMLLPSLALFVHAFFPWLLPDYASGKMKKLYEEIVISENNTNIQQVLLENRILKMELQKAKEKLNEK